MSCWRLRCRRRCIKRDLPLHCIAGSAVEAQCTEFWRWYHGQGGCSSHATVQQPQAEAQLPPAPVDSLQLKDGPQAPAPPGPAESLELMYEQARMACVWYASSAVSPPLGSCNGQPPPHAALRVAELLWREVNGLAPGRHDRQVRVSKPVGIPTGCGIEPCHALGLSSLPHTSVLVPKFCSCFVSTTQMLKARSAECDFSIACRPAFWRQCESCGQAVMLRRWLLTSPARWSSCCCPRPTLDLLLHKRGARSSRCARWNAHDVYSFLRLCILLPRMRTRS